MDLTIIWFWLISFLFAGYFVLDGFDFGVGISLPFISKDNVDRRVLINTIGPVWDFNETWVIVAGAALFAAFPEWYATLFSGFYLILLLILLALIVRGVSFEFRHQGRGPKWTQWFDGMIFVGSVLPAFLWGVLFSNIVQGVVLDEDHNYIGSVLDLLNPYAILGGLATLLLFFLHGLLFVALKTFGDIRNRARKLASVISFPTIVTAAIFLLWTGMANGKPLFWLPAALAAIALVAAYFANLRAREGVAFTLTSTAVAAAVLSLFVALFPNVMPAANNPDFSLTISNASSGLYTLGVMSWLAVFALPLVIVYQIWTYWIFRRRITRKMIEAAH